MPHPVGHLVIVIPAARHHPAVQQIPEQEKAQDGPGHGQEPEVGIQVPDEDRIDISIHDIGEVTSISEAVWHFCDAHGVDKFKRYCASLCLEEMAGNIVQHGFSKDRKKHSVDIRVSYVRDELRLNIKDDCVPFNPVEVSKLFDPDDRTHNLGLRVTAGVTKEMSYQSTFGLNILSLTI